MKKKHLFLVGISITFAKSAIRRAQKLGYEVILGDSEANLNDYAHLVERANKLVVTDYTQYDNLSLVTRNLQKETPLDAIFTFKETALLATAKVQQEYGLLGNSPEIVEACINKFTTRNLLKKAGMLSPSYKLCRTLEEAEDFRKTVQVPIIIKPHNLRGSVGIFKSETKTDLEFAFYSCLKHCQDQVVLVEEFLRGQEISIEAIVYRGKAVLFGVTEKLFYPGTFVEAGHISPYSGKEMTRQQYEQIVQKIVNAIGIKFGPLHIEGFHTPNGFVVGEVHTRYGGDYITPITELAIDCDMLTPVFAELGDIPYEITFGQLLRVAGVHFLNIEPGIIKFVEGVSQVKALPEVVDLEVNCQPGEFVNPIQSSFDRMGWILAKAATREELKSVFEKAFNLLQIVTE